MIELDSLDQTLRLARAFARCAADHRSWPAILMRGQLGAGKTTFIRELVQALPGSEQADISSPSFNIVNLYPTTPPVSHFDLYRTGGRDFSADLEEILLDARRFCLMEWAEYLPRDLWPESCLEMIWSVDQERRRVALLPLGPEAQAMLACVLNAFQCSPTCQPERETHL